jgi:hypothetical protein
MHACHVFFVAYQDMAPGIFSVGEFSLLDYIVVSFLLFLSIFSLPLKLERPSVIFFYSIYLLMFVPALVFIVGQKREIDEGMQFLLFSLLLGLYIISIPSSWGNHERIINGNIEINKNFLVFCLTGWTVLALCLFFKYHEIMQFSGLDEIYSQREKVRLDGLFWGYSQVYFSYFFSSIILAAGIFKKKYALVFLGGIGFLIMYMITAERSIFLYPFLIFFVYKVTCLRRNFIFLVSIFLIACSFVNLLVAFNYQDSELLNKIGFYYFTRIVAIPGQFIYDYYVYFSDVGYTYWAHVRGIDMLVSPPLKLALEPLWPQLGWIVGENVHGLETNSNASFWATDGVAAAGSIGVIVVSIILAIYLYILDFCSRKWPLEFVVPALFPLAFILTNGSLFTILLSYGGFLWIAVLSYFKQEIVKEDK